MIWLRTAVDWGVIGLLVLLSTASGAVAIERFLTFGRIGLDDFTDRRALEIELTRRLGLIATVGSNAPYLGLLGTVLGIMLTFYDIGQSGFADTSKVMVGLALALKATAVGLLVAIPSVAVYNLLLRRAKVLLLEWEIRHG